MARSVNDILLNVLGDSSDAQDAIAILAGELAVFSRIEAEAEAVVDTHQSEEQLELLRARLTALDLTHVTPEVEAKVGQAIVDIEVLQRELAGIDRHVEVDIDVHRGIHERINQVTNGVLSLIGRLRQFQTEGESFMSSLNKVGVQFGPLTARLGTFILLMGGMSALVAAAVGALTALISSAAAAAAAVGALAIAFGGLATVGIGFIAAAIGRFSAQADIAGTAANELKQSFEGFKPVLNGLMSAADPVFRALADGLRQLKANADLIIPAFRGFGQVAGDAMQTFIQALSSPAIARSVAQLIALSAQALEPAAQAAAALARIFLNIANAAMPFLISGFRAVARGLTDIANSTDDAQGLSNVIGTLVGHLESWINLAGQIGRVFLGVFKAAAPAGKELVDALAEGADKLADWINSAEGTDRIQQFLEDTIPLAEQVGRLIFELAVAFLQIGQFIAPALTPIVSGFADVVGILNDVLSFINKIPAPVRAVIGTIASLVFGFGKLRAAGVGIKALIGIFSGFAGIIGGVARIVGGAFVTAFNIARNIVVGAFNRIRSVVTTVAGVVKAVVATLVAAVLGRFRALRAVAGVIFNALRTVAVTAFNVMKGVLTSVANAIRSAVSSAFRAMLNAARSVFNTLKSAASSAFRAVISAARSILGRLASAFSTAINTAVTVVKSAVSAFFDAGVSLIQGLIDGIASKADEVANAVSDLADKAKSVLPFSEPKDPNSPFRNLAQSGQAIIRNIAEGVLTASPELQSALTNAMRVPQMPVAPTARSITNNWNIQPLAGGGNPDPQVLVAQLEMAVRSRGEFSA